MKIEWDKILVTALVIIAMYWYLAVPLIRWGGLPIYVDVIYFILLMTILIYGSYHKGWIKGGRQDEKY